MKIAIRLTPTPDGRWHWSLGRGGMENGSGTEDSFEAAERAAESAACAFAEASGRTTFYLYDTATRQRSKQAD